MRGRYQVLVKLIQVSQTRNTPMPVNGNRCVGCGLVGFIEGEEIVFTTGLGGFRRHLVVSVGKEEA